MCSSRVFTSPIPPCGKSIRFSAPTSRCAASDIFSHGPNNDGCDPECSRDVLIDNCLFDTGDDCIAIKSGKNADGRRVNVPSENIIVRDCTMKDGHGGVVVGSEDFRRRAQCLRRELQNGQPESGPRLAPENQRATRRRDRKRLHAQYGGRHVQEVLTIDLVYGKVEGGAVPSGCAQRFHADVTATNSPRVLDIVGTADSVISNIHLDDCVFRGVRLEDTLDHAGEIALHNVTRE